jgi:L-histidine Nalpha-methyltransferase / hercynylcysteine S-oxide synthase
MISSNITTIPATWSSSSSNGTNGTNGTHETNGANGHSNGTPSNSFIADKSILTVFGPVPLALALDWPVMASYDELAGCAAWMGGRIPTFEEARSIYTYVEDMKTKDSLNSKLANKVPAVNG